MTNTMNKDKTAEIVNDRDREFMRMAARMAEENVTAGGGPFAALIVKDGTVIASGVNTVTLSNDPTAHAEVNAIRNACSKLGSFSLKGCRVYSSCEPCPMCLSALYWAGVERIYFGNTKDDADAIDFSDRFIYREIEKPALQRAIPCIHVRTAGNIRAFEMWAAKEDKTPY